MKTFESVVRELVQDLKDGSIVLDKDAPKRGRPRSTERCDCGEMTKTRAQKRGHVCEAKEEMPWKD